MSGCEKAGCLRMNTESDDWLDGMKADRLPLLPTPTRFSFVRLQNLLFAVCVLVFLITTVTFRRLGSFEAIPHKPETVQFPPIGLQEAESSSLLDNACKVPWIFPMEDDIRGWSLRFGPITCTKQMANLAYLNENHVLTIQNDLDAKWSLRGTPIKCNVSAIKGGLKPKIGEATLVDLGITLRLGEQRVMPVDQFVVDCWNETNSELLYSRAFAGFAKQEEKKGKAPLATPTAPSLVVFIIDSTARNQFVRHAPLSYELMNKLGFVSLNGYTKVGDNSGVNLFPAKRGCISMFNDDIMHPNRGLFAYHHHNGFEKPPTDYFFRPFSLVNVRKEVKPALGHCTIHGQSVVNQHFGFIERFSRVFKDHCHFSVNFFTSTSRELGVEDEEIRSTLEKFSASGVLNNTVVVVMGDHGNRIGGIQFTYTGRIEERMPLFALYLPPGLAREHPHFLANLRYNSNRLTSNYDVYRTLRTIAQLGGQPQKEQIHYRGYSLLADRVPTNRTCTEAGIPPNFCTCLQSRPLPKYERGQPKYAEIEALIREMFLTNPHSCILGNSVKLMDETIRSFSVDPMVRQGRREMNRQGKKWALFS
ncbi:hypothetical protein M3Y99_01807400 [Aphelenchoides fujianensis]|nr:hypothetical protein M3Y99_01807400 [Aphelenchoides fujianensis]